MSRSAPHAILRPRTPSSTRAFLALVLVVGGVAAQGRLVVADDEWAVSTSGFSLAPPGAAATYVQNLCLWMNGGSPGSFLVCSNNFSLTSAPFAAALAAGGNTKTLWAPTLGAPTAALFAQYDGVFFAGSVPGAGAGIAAEIVAYVQGGGSVAIACGTGTLPGSSGGAANEANFWNPVITPFGLQIASVYNGYSGVLPCAFPHPLFTGVPSLYWNNGNTVSATGAVPNALIFGTAAKPGRFGVYDAGLTPLYQTNQPQASMTVNGLTGTAFTPPPPGGATGTLELSSTLLEAPWDMLYTLPDPVVALGAGAVQFGDLQIVNVDVFSPNFVFLFGVFAAGNFPGPFTYAYAFPPGSPPFSMQMVLLDSGAPLGFRLSAPARIVP